MVYSFSLDDEIFSFQLHEWYPWEPETKKVMQNIDIFEKELNFQKQGATVAGFALRFMYYNL